MMGKAISLLKDHLDHSVSTRIRYLLRKYKYGAGSPRRYRLIRVDPDDIGNIIIPPQTRNPDVSKLDTNILPGNWDKNKSDQELMFHEDFEDVSSHNIIPLENYELYNSMKDHFYNDVPWENTDIYSFFLENVVGEYTDRRYGTKQKVLNQFEQLDCLYYQMNKHGYFTQKQLADRDDFPFSQKQRPHPNYHEVVVSIGRKGEFFLNDGRHRFIIAKLLGIESIPVRVLVRHELWQQKRTEIANVHDISKLGPELQKYTSHPDLAYIMSKKAD